MKRFLSVIVVLMLVLLCGCAKTAETSEPAPAPQADVTDFSSTTLWNDNVLTLRILSATKLPASDGTDGVGVAYAIGMKNNADEPINVTLNNITVNGLAIDTDYAFSLEKGESLPTTFALESAKLEAQHITRVEKVAFHLTATSKERWSAPALLERDLVFYTPLAAATATATATAAA